MFVHPLLSFHKVRQILIVVLMLNLFAGTLCLLDPRAKAESELTTNFNAARISSSLFAEPAPTPSPSPVPFKIEPSTGVQGKEYGVVVTGTDCTNHPATNLRLYAPAGSGLTVSDVTQHGCKISAKVTVAPDAPLNDRKLWLTNKDANPARADYALDFLVTGVTAGPIPPGLNNVGQVDVLWSVLPNKITKHNFGSGVSDHFYAIEVVIGNNSGYDLQLSSVGFTLPALGDNYRVPGSAYRTVRGSLESYGELSTRKIVLDGLKVLGPVFTGILPFFHATNRKANFSTITNLITNPLEKGIEAVWPDLLPTQLDRLADQAYRDDVSTKTIVPNNVQARITTFVPKKLVCENKKTCAGSDKDRKKFNPDDPQQVMLALGEIVIIGQQVQHVNRIRVVNNPFGSSITDHSVSGKITDACNRGVGGVTLTLSAGAGFFDRTVTTAADGTYTFANVPDGRTYTITPTMSTSSPSVSPPFLLNDTKANVDFSVAYVVVGKLTKGTEPLKTQIVNVAGQDITTDDAGEFRLEVPASTARPIKIKPKDLAGHKFTPAEIQWNCDPKPPDFVATPTASPSP